jgi:hypothetical protein
MNKIKFDADSNKIELNVIMEFTTEKILENGNIVRLFFEFIQEEIVPRGDPKMQNRKRMKNNLDIISKTMMTGDLFPAYTPLAKGIGIGKARLLKSKTTFLRTVKGEPWK